MLLGGSLVCIPGHLCVCVCISVLKLFIASGKRSIVIILVISAEVPAHRGFVEGESMRESYL